MAILDFSPEQIPFLKMKLLLDLWREGNARLLLNLKTLHIDFSVSKRLIKQIPKRTVVVIESGIDNKNDILRYQRLGAHNFLIGTVLMKSRNVSKKINELSERAESTNATG